MTKKTKYSFVRADFKLEVSNLAKEIAGMEPLSVRNTISLDWAKANDFIVYDGVGNKWIDMTSGIFVTNAGHGNPKIKEAICRELENGLLFSYNYPTEIKLRFLKKLLSISPGYFNRVALLMTGSEAVDLAYKLVKIWGRKKERKYIITFKGSYHGRGLSNDLICGSPEKAGWSGVIDPDIVFIDFPYEDCEFNPSLLPPANEISAFFLETFQGWGAWFYPQKFISSLYKFAKKAGALVCFDEMQAGFYRTGPLYGYMAYGTEIKPDIICLGKGISSSLPIAAVLTRNEIIDLDPKADMHGTHSGNPICCAAALANLEFLSSEDFQRKLKKRINVFEQEAKKLSQHQSVIRVNVRGMIAGIIFENEKIATSIVKKCVEKGLLAVCTNRNSIKLAPPLTIEEEAIEEGFEILCDAIVEMTGKYF